MVLFILNLFDVAMLNSALLVVIMFLLFSVLFLFPLSSFPFFKLDGKPREWWYFLPLGLKVWYDPKIKQLFDHKLEYLTRSVPVRVVARPFHYDCTVW